MSNINIEIYSKLHGTKGKIDGLNKSLGRTSTESAGLSPKLGGLWKQFAAGYLSIIGIQKVLQGATGLIRSFMSVATETENYEVRLKALLGSQEAATEAMEHFQDIASQVPFTLKEVIEAGTIMTAMGADYKKWTTVLSDLAAVMGMSLPEAASAMGRAFAGGAGAADIFRERGILQIIKDSARMKSGIDDITKLTLPQFRDAMYDAFTDPNGKIAGAAADLAKTWDGMISMLDDAWFQFRQAVMDAGVFDMLKEGLEGVLTWINKMKDEGKLKEWAEDTAEALQITISALFELAELAKTGATLAFGRLMQKLKVTKAWLAAIKVITKGTTEAMKKGQIPTLDNTVKAWAEYDNELRTNIESQKEGKKWAEANKNELADLANKVFGLDINLEGMNESLENVNENLGKEANKIKSVTTQIETQIPKTRQIVDQTNMWRRATLDLVVVQEQAPAKMEDWHNAVVGATRDMTGITKWAGIQIERTWKGTGAKIKVDWKKVAENITTYWLEGVADMIGSTKSFGDLISNAFKLIATGVGSAIGDLTSKALKSIGGLAGPIGSVVGAVAGMAISAIGSLFKVETAAERAAKEAARLARELEMMTEDMIRVMSVYGEITESTAKKIAEAAQKMAGWAAVSLNFADVIRDVGVNQGNLNELWRRTTDILYQLSDGYLDVGKAQDALNESFNLLLEGARKIGQEGSAEMIRFIETTRELGISVAAVSTYVLEQLDRIPSALTLLVDNIKVKIWEVFGEDGEMSLSISQATKKSANALKVMGEIANVTFQGMLAEGRSYSESLAAMRDPLEALMAKYEEMGIAVPEYLTPMIEMIELMDLKPKVFENLDAALTILDALKNSAYLSQEAFNALAQSATKAAREILGATGNLNAYLIEAAKTGDVTKGQIEMLMPIIAQFAAAAGMFGLDVPAWMKTFVEEQLDIDWKEFKKGLADPQLEANKTLNKIHLRLIGIRDVLHAMNRKMGGGFQHGGTFTVSKPTMITVHPEELIDITPFNQMRGKPSMGTRGSIKLIIQIGTRKVAEAIIPDLEELQQQGRLTQDVQTLVRVEQ